MSIVMLGLSYLSTRELLVLSLNTVDRLSGDLKDSEKRRIYSSLSQYIAELASRLEEDRL